MDDFVVMSAAWMLNQEVKTYDADGNLLPDDGEYQRRGAEIVYIFAEFMRDKGLLQDGVEVVRTSNFELKFSQLTDAGQRFTRVELDRWVRSLDRAGPDKEPTSVGLERRFKKFSGVD